MSDMQGKTFSTSVSLIKIVDGTTVTSFGGIVELYGATKNNEPTPDFNEDPIDTTFWKTKI
jgi:hypothetical protein